MFPLIFQDSAANRLDSGLCKIEHAALGTLSMLLGPVNQNGTTYEAVNQPAIFLAGAEPIRCPTSDCRPDLVARFVLSARLSGFVVRSRESHRELYRLIRERRRSTIRALNRSHDRILIATKQTYVSALIEDHE